MGSPVTADLKIPDIWYDFYTRLLPGFVLVTGLWLICVGPKEPSATVALAALPLGFAGALIIQPFSMRIRHEFQVHEENRSAIKVSAAKRELGDENRRSLILSKIGAEITFFSQIAVIGLLLVLLSFILQKSWHYFTPPLFLLLAGVVGTWLYSRHLISKTIEYMGKPAPSD